jgi:hypothetical protein
MVTQNMHRVSDRAVASIDSAVVDSSPHVLDRSAGLLAAVDRITIRRTTLEIQLAEGMAEDASDRILIIPWTPPSPYRRREIIQGEGGRFAARRPMRAEARALLIDALRDAHCWQDELIRDPSCTIASIAAREKKTERSIRMTLSLSFLSPALVKAAVEDDCPRLWRQALDGPSDGLVGSMVRAGSPGVPTDLIETRATQPTPHGARVSSRDCAEFR